MCIRQYAKYFFYFNPIFLSAVFKELFLFYNKRRLKTNWISSMKVSQLLAEKKLQDLSNHNSITYHGTEISRKICCLNTVGLLFCNSLKLLISVTL